MSQNFSEAQSASIPGHEFEIQTTMQQSIMNAKFLLESSPLIHTCLRK